MTNRITHQPSRGFYLHLLRELVKAALAKRTRRKIYLLAGTATGTYQFAMEFERVEKNLAAAAHGIEGSKGNDSRPGGMIFVSKRCRHAIPHGLSSFPMSDVGHAALTFGSGTPHCAHSHADFNLLGGDFFNHMQDSHARRSAVDLNHCRDLRLFQAPHVPTHVAKRERDNLASVFQIYPFIGRTKATLAKHAWRDHHALAAVAATRDQASSFKLFEVAPDSFAGVPAVA